MVYSLKNNPTLANLVLENIGAAGQIKRKIYQRRLPENPNKDYYYILRESGNTEPILIEYGFIDNKKDANKLKNNITNYAEGVVKAITEYINYPYTPPQTNYYTVQKGDTLYFLSKRFNIPIEDIKRINNLATNQLQIGQKLFLTEQLPEIETFIYIVERGDTLYSIAIKNNTTIDTLRKLNNLTDNTLAIGQNLKIPILKNQEIIEESSLETYIVKKGDSLWKISQKYNISVPELIKLNNLENLTLQINQELKVPKNQRKENTYTVKKGDTLWSIAHQHDLEVSKLKELNNLENNLLFIGQNLITK